MDIVADAINSESPHKRFLMLLDTAEKWEEEESHDALIYLLKKLQNVLFIVAAIMRGIERIKRTDSEKSG